MRIVVSGIGITSALGLGVESNITQIKKGQSGISLCPEILHTDNKIPVGELKRTNEELKSILQIKGSQPISRTALLGILAVQEAITDANLNLTSRVGLVSSTSVGGMDLTEHFFKDFIQDESKGRLRYVKMHDCAASTNAIADYCKITGYTTTISTACSSAANSIIIGCRLLRHGIVDSIIVGGADALSAFTLNGFKSLMILDQERCRPFDQNRAGLNLGEGAGYLVLQREKDASKAYCCIGGAANRNDAFHQTASSKDGDGAYLAMSDAMKMANLSPSDIDYINVHGTGTANNDLSEGIAMKRLFNNQIPPFSSTKVFTGHTLAAAGGIEAVFSALSVKYGYIYPTLHFNQPIEELGCIPCTEFTIKEEGLSNVLSNSFGFGGNCSSILFTK